MAVDVFALFYVAGCVSDGVPVFYDVLPLRDVAESIFVTVGKVYFDVVKLVYNYAYSPIFALTASASTLKSSSQRALFARIVLTSDFFINSVTSGSSFVISVL